MSSLTAVFELAGIEHEFTVPRQQAGCLEERMTKFSDGGTTQAEREGATLGRAMRVANTHVPSTGVATPAKAVEDDDDGSHAVGALCTD